MLGNSPSANSSSLRPDVFPGAVLALDLDGGRYALWPDHGDLQQVLITAPVDDNAPVAAIVPLDAHTAARLDAVRKLWRRLTGRSSVTSILPITMQQRRRLILMLRALDGWREHASYRDLAAALLNADVRPQGRRDWLLSSSRAQIIRIVRDGIGRMEGGYRDLLLGH